MAILVGVTGLPACHLAGVSLRFDKLTVPVHRGSDHRRGGPTVKRNLAHGATDGDGTVAAPLRRRKLLRALLEPLFSSRALRPPLCYASFHRSEPRVSTRGVRSGVASHPVPRGGRPRAHRQAQLALPEDAAHVIPEEGLAASHVHDVPPPLVQHVDAFLHHAADKQKRDGLLAFLLDDVPRRAHARAECTDRRAHPRAAPAPKRAGGDARECHPAVRREHRVFRSFDRIRLLALQTFRLEHQIHPPAIARRPQPFLVFPLQAVGE